MGKPLTAKAAFAGVEYSMETRIMTFIGKGESDSFLFYGVPPELYYGMPTGINLATFIALKLKGRYSMTQIKAAPIVYESGLNKEVRVDFGLETWTWSRLKDEPSIPEGNSLERYKFFAEHYKRPPDKVEKNRGPLIPKDEAAG